MMQRIKFLTAAATTVLLAAAVLSRSDAQQPAPTSRPSATKQTTAAPAKTPAADHPAPAAAGGEVAALRQRIEQLEEQLVDMQVTIGTLESLARGGAAGAGAARQPAGLPNGGADMVRVEALENQVRTLGNMVEQMQQQLRQARGGQPAPGPQVATGPAAAPAPAPGAVPGFQTQVTPGASDPIDTIIRGGQPGAAPVPTAAPSLPQAGASDGSAKDLYATAYGLLLAQDYASAEAAFDEFLKRFPSDQLAGNAQYWLGETFYVRGNFKSAAAAFLKGYQTYSRSSKAADSLLKLAMSLDRLGQRDAACQSFSELNTRYPNAPGAIRSRADNERRRLGCV